MHKKKLLDHLKNDIYCRIGISKISGVGVIAVKEIPKGVNPFKNLSDEKDKIIELDDNDIINLDTNVKKILNDFFGNNVNKNGKKKKIYDVLYQGPNYINISFYMNHSKHPNIDIIDGKSNYLEFITNKIIKVGEELTINYDEYDL